MGAESDRLIAKLGDYLRANLTAAALRSRGWSDFRFLEGNHSDDPVGLAYQAFLYLFCPGQKRWDRCSEGIIAILAFLEDEVRIVPSLGALEELKTVLIADPLVPDALWDWFATYFPP